jgi:hypothetical protein
MNPSDIYGHYKRVMASLGSLQKQLLRSVPDEIVEELRAKDLVDVRTLLDPLAPPPTSQRGDVIFADKTRNGYFAIDPDYTNREITSITTSALESLAAIGNDFSTLSESWKTWVESFDAYSFWNQESEGFRIVNETFQPRQHLENPASMPGVLDVQWPHAEESYNLRRLHRERVLGQVLAPMSSGSDQPNHSVEQVNTPSPPLVIPAPQPERKRDHLLRMLSGASKKQQNSVANGSQEPVMINTEALPYGFDPDRYLRMNPDVKAAGQDPVTHYLRYGRHEHRQY